VLQTTGCFRLPLKSRAGGIVFDKPLIENFYRYWSIDQHVPCAVDGAHSADAKALFDSILFVESFADQRIARRFTRNRGIGLQRSLICRTELNVRCVVLSACGAMKHQYQ